MRLFGSAATLAALLAGPSSHAQEAIPGVKSELVRLDVVVTDAQGHTVPNLTLADFELREDGKVQRVSRFVAAGGDALALESPAGTKVSGSTDATRPDPGEGRHVVVFVDDLHIQATNLVRAQASAWNGPREVRVGRVEQGGTK